MAEGRSEEHSLEYQELFNEYLLMFEGKLEEFIGEAGCGIYCSLAGGRCRACCHVSFRSQEGKQPGLVEGRQPRWSRP